MPSKTLRRIVLFSLLLTAAAVAVSALSQGAASDVATKSAVQATAESFRWIIEWLRVVGGLVATVAGIAGVVGWYKISIRNKEVENLKSANESWRIRVESQDAELVDVKKSRDRLIARIEEKDTVLKELQARTDLTPVIDMLTNFIKVQDSRYLRADEAIREMNKMADGLQTLTKIFMERS